MFYTVTFNPSIDFIVQLDKIQLHETNRAYADKKFPGGKGIIVSEILKNLDRESINMGFVGGFTGTYIRRSLKAMGIREQFVEVSQDSRINVKLKAEGETEINTPGPFICEREQQEFIRRLDICTTGDFVVLSGSLPQGVSEYFYHRIFDLLHSKGVDFTVDTSGTMLMDSFSYRPFLIKPNLRELEELFQTKILTTDEVLYYARQCIDKGCRNVIVSMGKGGAVFTNGKESYFAAAVSKTVVNSVGAGDSMVAGFIACLDESEKQAFHMACACAAATTFSEGVGSRKTIEKMYEQIQIKRI